MTFRIEDYRWRGGCETMLRFGPRTGPTIVAAPALFEEANRTRALLAGMMRRLGERGIGAALPDLPGQSDSLVPTIDARLSDWRSAFAAVAASLPDPVHVVAIRGGALVGTDAAAASRWHLSPMAGEAIVHELRRQRELGGGDDYAGNRIHDDLIDALAATGPTIGGRLRIVRLDGDPRPADRHVAGTPPWRAVESRAEPALTELLAADVAEWVARCGA